MPKGQPLIPLAPEPPRYNSDELAEAMTAKLVTGKGEIMSKSGPASAKDMQVLKRIVGESVEVFNSKLSEMLADVAVDTVVKIKQKLAADEFKTSELAFLFSVMHDKRLSMDGRAQVTNAAINVQINNYGSSASKDDLIKMLEGRMPVQVVPAAEPEPVEKMG